MTIAEQIMILSQDSIRESKIVVLWHLMLLLHNGVLGTLVEIADSNIFFENFYTPELSIFQLTSLGFGLGLMQHFL